MCDEFNESCSKASTHFLWKTWEHDNNVTGRLTFSSIWSPQQAWSWGNISEHKDVKQIGQSDESRSLAYKGNKYHCTQT